jgi:hypothetical protein
MVKSVGKICRNLRGKRHCVHIAVRCTLPLMGSCISINILVRCTKYAIRYGKAVQRTALFIALNQVEKMPVQRTGILALIALYLETLPCNHETYVQAEDKPRFSFSLNHDFPAY